MKRKEAKIFAYVLLWLLIPQLHTLINEMETNVVDLIKYVDFKQDIQWYYKDMCDYLASLFLLMAFRLILPVKFKIIGLGLIATQLIDIVNYWLFFHQFDWTYKSIIIFIIITIITLRKNEKRNNNRSSA
jgi:hypothetical protein